MKLVAAFGRGRLLGLARASLGLMAFLFSMLIGRADGGYQNTFCTIQVPPGQVFAVNLRIPKSGRGTCSVLGISSVSVLGSVMSGPVVPSMPSSRVTPDSSESGRSNWIRLIQSSFNLKDLGTLRALQGDSFFNCQLLSTTNDGIIIVHSLGISKILLSDLDPQTQKGLLGH